MDQRSPDPSNRGTQPLKSPNTRHFSDAFVSSSGQPAAMGRGTRPLQTPPMESLKLVVPQRIDAIDKDLNYVRHLTVLFAIPVTVLRYALYLAEHPLTGQLDPSDDASETIGSEFEDPPVAEAPPTEDTYEIPEPFQVLSIPQRELARESARIILTNPKLKQRVQVSLFQYDETLRTYEESAQAIEEIYACSFEEAWDRLNELGIERLKGKAYAICGFYDNYKHDGALGQIFPAPNASPKMGSGSLSGNAGRTAPLVQPVQPVMPVQLAPQEPPSVGGLLSKVKGLFNRG